MALSMITREPRSRRAAALSIVQLRGWPRKQTSSVQDLPSDVGLSRNGDRDVVVAGANPPLREELRLLHPAMGPFEHFPRIGLEHQPFSWSEPADFDHVVIFSGQFFEEVMFVTLRLQIDVSLRALQRLK